MSDIIFCGSLAMLVADTISFLCPIPKLFLSLSKLRNVGYNIGVLGIASLLPSAENTLRDLIQQADQALYTAKKQGRDRTFY